MGEVLRIDPDAVERASKDLTGLVDELEAQSLEVSSGTSNTLRGIEIGVFEFRTALTSAVAFWAKRAAGFRERLADSAEYMATNAALAREHDESATADFVELDAELHLGLDEYSRQDYCRVVGVEPPPGGTDAMPVGGESVLS